MNLAFGPVAALVVSLGMSGFAKTPEPDPLSTSEIELQGTWKTVAIEAAGEKAPESITSKLKLTFKGRSLIFDPAEPGFAHFRYKLSPALKPTGFEMVQADGNAKGEPVLGIYVIEGDTLKICLGGKDRPRAFESGPDSQNAIYTLQRVAK